MMGNFFNRMYYGKGNKGDYTKDDLPGNRWQLFLSMLRLNIGKLISINLLFVLFMLPTIIWIAVMNMPIISELLQAGNSLEAQQYFQVATYGMLPCFIILGPGVVGMTYISRNMAKDQNIWIWADFWGAVKDNWKQMLAVSAMNGLFLILAYIANIFYSSSAAGSVFFLIPQTVVIVMYVCWCLMNFYLWPLMVTYELSIKALIRNAALLTIARLPQTLFMAVFTLVLPAVFLLSDNIYIFIGLILIYLLFGFSVNSLAINSVTNGIFDKYINLRIKGAKVNQGLRVEYDEDGEDSFDDDDEEAESEEGEEEK